MTNDAEQKKGRGTRYVIGVDEAHGFDKSLLTMLDSKTGRIVWTAFAENLDDIRWPWWLRLRMFFRQVTIVREVNTLSEPMRELIAQRGTPYRFPGPFPTEHREGHK